MRLALLLLFSIALHAPAAASPQAAPAALPPADPALPAASALLEQSAAYLGTPEKLAAIESYRLEAEGTVAIPPEMQMSLPHLKRAGALLWRRDGRASWTGWREDLALPAKTVSTRRFACGARDGVAWTRVPGEGAPVYARLPGPADPTQPNDPLRVLYRGIARHQEALLDARTVRRTRRAGKDCHEIAALLKLEPGDRPTRITLWLDVTQSRVVEVERTRRVRYDDWREVDGVRAPFKFSCGGFCADQDGSPNTMAEATLLAFNAVSADDVTTPEGMRDIADAVNAVDAAGGQAPRP